MQSVGYYLLHKWLTLGYYHQKLGKLLNYNRWLVFISGTVSSGPREADSTPYYGGEVKKTSHLLISSKNILSPEIEFFAKASIPICHIHDRSFKCVADPLNMASLVRDYSDNCNCGSLNFAFWTALFCLIFDVLGWMKIVTSSWVPNLNFQQPLNNL